MKRAKKPKQERYTFNRQQIKELCDEQVQKAFLLLMTAATDELELTEAEVISVAKRAERYAEYVDQHVVSMKNVSRILEENAGVKWRW